MVLVQASRAVRTMTAHMANHVTTSASVIMLAADCSISRGRSSSSSRSSGGGGARDDGGDGAVRRVWLSELLCLCSTLDARRSQSERREGEVKTKVLMVL